MTMECYFLRHGLAADAQTWEGRDDDRPLTREGKARMAREAETIAALSLGVDAIVTSPLLRAKQTAEIVASELKIRVEEDARLGIGFDREALAGILADRTDASAILLVGHEPGMSLTIGRVIGGGRVVLKKGALACVSLPDAASANGELVWLLPPKVLARR